MAFKIRRVDYYHTTVRDEPGEGYKLFSQLTELGIELLAFTGVPVGPTRTQLTIFPADSQKLEAEAHQAGWDLDGPHPALLVQGSATLGTLATIHEKLYQARINVYASSGVADGQGNFGYILYVRPEDYERALEALEV